VAWKGVISQQHSEEKKSPQNLRKRDKEGEIIGVAGYSKRLEDLCEQGRNEKERLTNVPSERA